MCELCFELQRKGSTIRINKKTPICPTCHFTAPTTIPILTLPTPCKSYILFVLLHQNTYAIQWKIIMDASRPNPHTQYQPLPIIPKNISSNPSRRVHTSSTLFNSRPYHINRLHHLPTSTHPQSRTNPSPWYLRPIVAPEIHQTHPPRHISPSPRSPVLLAECHLHTMPPPISDPILCYCLLHMPIANDATQLQSPIPYQPTHLPPYYNFTVQRRPHLTTQPLSSSLRTLPVMEHLPPPPTTPVLQPPPLSNNANVAVLPPYLK